MLKLINLNIEVGFHEPNVTCIDDGYCKLLTVTSSNKSN